MATTFRINLNPAVGSHKPPDTYAEASARVNFVNTWLSTGLKGAVNRVLKHNDEFTLIGSEAYNLERMLNLNADIDFIEIVE